MYVLVGDEDLLKRRCREAIVKLAVGDDDPEFALASYDGETELDLSTIRNELETLPFFCKVRVVIVDHADDFVTQHRPGLEHYFAEPSKAGILVLDVKTFPETTKLAKLLSNEAKLHCKSPAVGQLPGWCSRWAKATYGKALSNNAAGLLVELVGPHMGLLDRELDKLATSVGVSAEIRVEDVNTMVVQTAAANVFAILDAVGNARPAEALRLLHRLYGEGEEPLAILGALTSQLRKLANIGRSLALGKSEGIAMDEAKIPNFPQARQNAAKQVRHLGRRRLAQIPDWLVEINMGMKGGDELPRELQLERLLVKLAKSRV